MERDVRTDQCEKKTNNLSDTVKRRRQQPSPCGRCGARTRLRWGARRSAQPGAAMCEKAAVTRMRMDDWGLEGSARLGRQEYRGRAPRRRSPLARRRHFR